MLGLAFGVGSIQKQGCLSCHKGIEPVSSSHDFACTECHGGNERTRNKKVAHKGMHGGKNPSSPTVWEKGCGKCHAHELARVKSSLMYTNIGIIKNLRKAWGQPDGQVYATARLEAHDAAGKVLYAHSIGGLDTLSAEAYRKFCSACHVGYDRTWGYRAQHASGCAACHFQRNEDGTYEGKDKAIRGKKGYASTHRMEALPGNEACFRCHNRSGRIALTYQGLYDGNNALVPTKGGLPGPRLISEVRNVQSIYPDIHHEKGMECVDCHTSRDIMGEGYAYEAMNKQIEVACEDCHGAQKNPPQFRKISREDDPPLRESKRYKRPVRYGEEMVLTKKGRMFPNVFHNRGRFDLVTKRKGLRLGIKTIMASPEHGIVGHERLRCDACHTRAVPQCYGCHTAYDERLEAYDLIRGEELSDGAFSETEDMRLASPFPLVVDQENRIAPATPGCQTLLTYIDKNGLVLFKDRVPMFEGKRQFKFVPFYSHNTRKKAIGCRECHGNPAFVGLGKGLVSAATRTVTSVVRCTVLGKPLDALMEIKDGKLLSATAVAREGARPLDAKEIRRFFRANLCLACHDKPDPRVYGKTLDLSRLPRCLRRTAARSSHEKQR